MKAATLLVAVATVLFSTGTAPVQDADAVRAAIERHYTAIHGDDMAAVAEHHLNDFSWFGREGGLLLESGGEAAAERMGATLDFGSANVYMNHFDAQIYGDVAVATFYLVGSYTPADGVSTTGTSRVSAVWVREGSEWKEAHHHESPLLTGAVHP